MDNQNPEKPEDRRYVSINWIGPKYFETLGTPLLAGRDFNFQDRRGPRVAIINQAMARYFFGDGSPIRKHFTIDRDWKGFGDDMSFEIVGMVGDAKYYEIREATHRTIYLNSFQDGNVSSKFELRTSISPEAVVGDVRRTVRELLPTVARRINEIGVRMAAGRKPRRCTRMVLRGALGMVIGGLAIGVPMAFWQEPCRELDPRPAAKE